MPPPHTYVFKNSNPSIKQDFSRKCYPKPKACHHGESPLVEVTNGMNLTLEQKKFQFKIHIKINK